MVWIWVPFHLHGSLPRATVGARPAAQRCNKERLRRRHVVADADVQNTSILTRVGGRAGASYSVGLR